MIIGIIMVQLNTSKKGVKMAIKIVVLESQNDYENGCYFVPTKRHVPEITTAQRFRSAN